jgi:DNA polymerase-3 subunit alpha
VDRKFTKKEGKPFAVVVVEDLTGTLEVVLWNETYVPVASALEPGTVLAIRGTIDRRDDSLRATAQKVKVLKPETAPSNGNQATNGESSMSPVLEPVRLRFTAGCGAEELQRVRQILASSPGAQPVTLMVTSKGGETVRIDAGEPCRIELTPAIKEQLAPWLKDDG